MRARPLLILAVIVALFGAYLYFVERRLPTTDERALQAKKVFDLAREDVRAVTLAWDGQTVRLARDDDSTPDTAETDGETEATDRWRLLAPMTALADRAAVGDLVRDLTTLENSRTIEDVDRAEVGLDPPRATVTLHTADGDTVLEVGPSVPASSAMIVAVAGRRDAYQVPDTLWSTLTQSPGDWRDRQIFRDQRAAITQIRLIPGTEASASAPVQLTKRDNDFWLESPIVDHADSGLASALLGAITGLRVTDFVDNDTVLREATVAPGLSPPFGRVEVVLDGRAEPFVVEVGSPAPAADTLYARVGGQVFTAAATELRTALERPTEAWQSRAWTRWQVFDIDHASITDETGTVTLIRTDGDWQRDGDKIDFTIASDLLYALNDVRADDVVARTDLDASLLAAPSTTITLKAADGRTERLSIYQRTGDVWATTGGRNAVLVFGPAVLDDWNTKLDALRAATPIVDDGSSEDEETDS